MIGINQAREMYCNYEYNLFIKEFVLELLPSIAVQQQHIQSCNIFAANILRKTIHCSKIHYTPTLCNDLLKQLKVSPVSQFIPINYR